LSENNVSYYFSINKDDKDNPRHSGGSVESFASISDSYPKTDMTLTTINIVKAFLGLGVLASPSGFAMCGFIPASILLLLNGALNVVTIHF
jgi:hypothetical protein